jgi:hypothetical protein
VKKWWSRDPIFPKNRWKPPFAAIWDCRNRRQRPQRDFWIVFLKNNRLQPTRSNLSKEITMLKVRCFYNEPNGKP